jgi:AAA+ ATPase superfamily predicted ATPase
VEATVFWDRERELGFLEKEYRKPGGSLMVVYGRRRVGKTTLLKEFMADKPALYFLADQQLETEQRRRFQETLASFLADPLILGVEFKNWDTLFAYLEQHASFERKVVLVLDEFQYLARANPAFPSILQRLWDERWRERNVFLLLCGSLVGMMYNTTLSYQSPLYGRRTGQIRLRPLSFVDYGGVFPQRSFNQQVELYSVTGGVPKYIEAFAGEHDLLTLLTEQVLDRHGPLYDEPHFVLSEEISEGATYFSILRAIAHGERKVGKIAGLLEVQTNRLSRYLRTLIDLDLLEHRVPITETQPEKSKRGLYFLADQFFRFWFHYVFPNRSYLEVGNVDYVRRKIEDSFDQYVSLAFEECCRQHLWHLMEQGKLPFTLQRIGAWWSKDAEIDVVGLNEETGDIVFGECKWSRQPVAMATLAALRDKARCVDWRSDQRQEHFVLFSRRGFDQELLDAARRREVILFSEGERRL